MRLARLLATVGAIVAAVALGLAACGASTHDGVIVRVGKDTIDEGDLARRIAAIAPEHVAPDPPGYGACIAHQEAISPQSVKTELREECQRQYRTLRAQALGFLISSRWLIGEATSSGLKASDGGVQARLREEGERISDGAARADAELEIEAELSAAKIRQMLTSKEPEIPQARIARYYKQHIRHFERREKREIELVEQLHSEAAARSAMARIEHGASLAKMAIKELVERPLSFAEIPPAKRVLRRVIFAVKPGVLVGPEPLNFLYAIFEVTHVQPRVVQPLVYAQGAIEAKLAEAQHRQTLARFIRQWRSRWTAITDCSPGYVVQKCRQYSGPRTPEEPLALN